jgi:hypothetical protein
MCKLLVLLVFLLLHQVCIFVFLLVNMDKTQLFRKFVMDVSFDFLNR